MRQLSPRIGRSAVSVILFIVCLFARNDCWAQQNLRVSIDPKDKDTLNGATAIQAGDYAMARDCLIQSLTKDPNNRTARECLAMAYFQLGLAAHDKPREALKLFQRAFYCEPVNPDVVVSLNHAVEQCQLKPDSFDDLVKLGDQSLAAGDSIGAIVEYRKALKIKSDDALRKKLAELPPPKELPYFTDASPIQVPQRPALDNAREVRIPRASDLGILQAMQGNCSAVGKKAVVVLFQPKSPAPEKYWVECLQILECCKPELTSTGSEILVVHGQCGPMKTFAFAFIKKQDGTWDHLEDKVMLKKMIEAGL